jgi:hypothetical protein
MILRIVSRVVGTEQVIELHGWLNGPEVAEFLRVCASSALPICIDLGNLAGADAEGILALREQEARGARLNRASPYIELLLHGPSEEGNGSEQA